MCRHDVTDREWNAIRNYFPKQRTGRQGRPWADHRKIVNGIFWVLCTGAPWRDVPSRYGKWQTVYKRFRQWGQLGLWDRIWARRLKRLHAQEELDRSLWCVDGSLVRAHHSSVGGSRKTSSTAGENALGTSRGGYSTKLHIVCDCSGVPLGIWVTAGNVNEPTEFFALMDSIPLSLRRRSNRPDAIAGDKAYIAGYIFQWLATHEIENVVPNRKNENKNPDFCRQTYRKRNIVERLIGKLKMFRRIATRYEKTADSYLSFLKIAFLRIMLRANK